MEQQIEEGVVKVLDIKQDDYVESPFMAFISNKVAYHYSLSNGRVLNLRTRRREVVLARQVAMALIKEIEPLIPLKAIGMHFAEVGKKRYDHSTVLHGIDKVNELRDIYELERRKIAAIKHDICEHLKNIESENKKLIDERVSS